jgi:hypothetical protein
VLCVCVCVCVFISTFDPADRFHKIQCLHYAIAGHQKATKFYFPRVSNYNVAEERKGEV